MRPCGGGACHIITNSSNRSDSSDDSAAAHDQPEAADAVANDQPQAAEAVANDQPQAADSVANDQPQAADSVANNRSEQNPNADEDNKVSRKRKNTRVCPLGKESFFKCIHSNGAIFSSTEEEALFGSTEECHYCIAHPHCDKNLEPKRKVRHLNSVSQLGLRQCVIYDWDSMCVESEETLHIMGEIDLCNGTDQPFYRVLLNDGSSSYVAQENLRHCVDPRPINNPLLGRYFRAYVKPYYIPNMQKAYEYPEDATIREQDAFTLSLM